MASLAVGVAVISFSATRAYLKAFVNIPAVRAGVVFTLFGLVELTQFAAIWFGWMGEIDHIAFETIDQTFAKRESDLK